MESLLQEWMPSVVVEADKSRRNRSVVAVDQRADWDSEAGAEMSAHERWVSGQIETYQLVTDSFCLV